MIRKLAHLTTWQVALLAAGFCVLLTVAVWLLGIAPLVAGYNAHIHRRQTLREHTFDASKLNRMHQDLQVRLQESRDEIARAPLVLLPATAINQRLSELTQLAALGHVQLDTLRPGATRPEQWYERVSIELTGRGEFAHCTLMIHRLLDNYPDMGIEGVEMSRNPSDPREPTTLRLEVVWFTAPPPPSP